MPAARRTRTTRLFIVGSILLLTQVVKGVPATEPRVDETLFQVDTACFKAYLMDLTNRGDVPALASAYLRDHTGTRFHFCIAVA